jgi:hypothetical protein
MEPEGSLPHSQVPATCPCPAVQVRGTCSYFVTKPVFTARSFHYLAQTPSWRTTPCRISVTAYSIYSQLPSISEAVPPTATWVCSIPWWQGPTYHGKARWLLYVTLALTFRNSTFCPGSLFTRFIRISEQRAIISLYTTDWLSFLTARVAGFTGRYESSRNIQVTFGS